MNDVQSVAARIAEVLAPREQETYARWRWGTVVASDGDEADVSIAGATVEGIRVAAHVYAPTGARVRVSYLGSDAVIDASDVDNGGGGGGTSDYRALENKPTIESTTIVGDLMLTDINLNRLTNTEIATIMAS